MTDASGGIVAGSAVTLTNAGTADQRTAKTDSEGRYQFFDLVPGTYRLDVETAGYSKFSRQAIDIQVQTATRVDVTLQVGDVKQTIEVVGASPLLQTESATLGSTIEGRQVLEMLPNGRKIANLVGLAPGVVPQGTSMTTVLNNQSGGTNPAGWNNYQISGAIAGANGAYLDGVTLNIIGNNPSWSAFVPTQDAIQEFKVETNNVDPAFGRFSGGVINFITKSGTNQVHGSAYEYFRNNQLNANNFFLNRIGSARQQLNLNQYGATAGAPIIRDKLFGYFSWEGYGERAALQYSATVPTAGQLQGNFSGLTTIIDPLNNAPFPNNIIPANRIDPTSNVLANTIKLWPLPNVILPGSNYASTTTTGGNAEQYNGRLDWNASSKHRLFARYSYWGDRTLPKDSFHIGIAGKGGPNHGPSGQLAVGESFAVSPTTLIEVRAGLTRFNYHTDPGSLGADLSPLGPNYLRLASQLSTSAYPWLTIPGYATLTYAGFIQHTTSTNETLAGSLTKIIGRHTVRIGRRAAHA